MTQEIVRKLCAPFPYESVEAKIQVTTKDKAKGMAVFYLDSRAIQKRLDEAAGAFNWTNHYSPWHGNSQICGISIYSEERGEWVTKHDGAENSDIEAIKGGLTDAFKRSAVLWGIGRYLYEIDGVWVEIEQRGNSSIIKDTQKGKLKAAYDAAVKRQFNIAPNLNAPETSARNGSDAPGVQGRTVTDPPDSNEASRRSPVPPPKSAQNHVPKHAHPETQEPVKAQAPVKEQASPKDVFPIHGFKVHSSKPAGSDSQLLELCNSEGEITFAYVKPGEPKVNVGAFLRNVEIIEKTGVRGNYNLLGSYDLAA